MALSPTPIATTHRLSPTTGQPWLLRPRISRSVTSPSSGYANRPNRAIDGGRTFTFQDSRLCWPLLRKSIRPAHSRNAAPQTRSDGASRRTAHHRSYVTQVSSAIKMELPSLSRRGTAHDLRHVPLCGRSKFAQLRHILPTAISALFPQPPFFSP